ncbi:sensor domain-containing phosphodiesterase [Aureimonas glaciei]|uniref:Sensor domain-containing phosphodiesterase n=1 Tax=Aureimonas glaciei TaxID=1776957 RepID=A0A916Y5C8_9HYPH|nr:EAL domain-containing protein [Aureimonas glaciei]GGD31164.1 sensor domain-containing phosphodiesterase [Aureimonas glaciei]
MAQSTESTRLDALRQLDLLDTTPHRGFDRITRLAAQIFGLPMALISLTDADRQWFKSRIEVIAESVPRQGAPCADVVETSSIIVVEDLLESNAYRRGAYARTGIRFYAGAPLVTPQGHCLGSLCVLGNEPRTASDDELQALTDLAEIVMAQVEMLHAVGRVDAISGMPNRNQFLDDLTDMALDEPGGTRMAVLVEIASSLEMDQAARVMGTRYFDEVVQAAAATIQAIIGPHRPLYHVGSTHFAFMAPSGVEKTSYAALLRSRTQNQHRTLRSGFLLSPRIGVSEFQLGDIEPREVLRTAHAAAQGARLAGDTVSFYSRKEDQSDARRYWILNAFKSAIAEDQLHLVYQPRVDLWSGECKGTEALVRWTHPESGAISPAEFVPIIESTGDIRSLTEWVVDASLAQMAAWQRQEVFVRLSINISPSNLEDTEFLPMLEQRLREHRISSDQIELEITEGAVMREGGNGLDKLGAISSMGLTLAIDDFGTGYSSLSYLQKLPVDVVKIDRSFLLNLTTDEKALTLVRAMITLCHDLGYRVVAEGIEDKATTDLLVRAGCDEGQGYYFGRPMLPDAFRAWLQDREKALL